MDQKKIGSFLKSLRKEKNITQEALAEILQVSGRTVSRWETGSNMPDISLLVKIAEFFDVSILEIINGERKSEPMEKEVKEVAEAMSDYVTAEKEILLRRAKIISIIGLLSLLAALAMETLCPDSGIPIYESVKGICFGFAVGALITMVLYTTGVLAKIRKKKRKYMKAIAAFCFAAVVVFLIMAVLASVGGCSVPSDDYFGFSRHDFTVVAEEDTHGGFHGDGEYYLILDCSDHQAEAEEITEDWKPLPLSENLELIMYGGEKDDVHYDYNLSKSAHLPVIEHGYYRFEDRSTDAEDPEDDSELFSRSAFNFSLGVYDSDTDRFYYFEFDT